MEEKKYELTDETIRRYMQGETKTFHRIKALKDFGNVKKGDLGGFIESEKNLIQLGKCWVYDNAMVFDNAYVCDNAVVSGNSRVHGDAVISENAVVTEYSNVFEHAEICENATISGSAMVYGDTIVGNYATINEDGHLVSNRDYIAINNIGPKYDNDSINRDDVITIFKSYNNSIQVVSPFFKGGTIYEFRNKIKELFDYNSIYLREYFLAMDLAMLHMGFQLKD